MQQLTRPLCLILLFNALALSSHVVSAEESAVVEEVIVTARKRQENLQEVPIAITAFSETAIERYDINNIRDVARLTPSLDFSEGLIASDTRPTMRGLALQAGRPSVAVLLDGVDLTTNPIFWDGGGNALASGLFELERVEVVRGPQSVMFGRNAFGGAVHYISKKPSETFEGQVSANLGNEGRRDAQLNLSGPITEGKLAYRLGLVSRQFDGFYKNSVDGRELGTEDNWGAGLSLQFTPSDDLTAVLRIQHLDEEYGEQAKLFVGNATAAFGTELDYDEDNIALNTYPKVDGIEQNSYTSESDMINLNLDWQLGDIVLTSITAWRNDDTNNNIDADFGIPSPTNPSPSFNHSDLDIEIEQISQEFRIASANDQPMRWLAGVLYWKEELDIERYDRIAFFNVANDIGRSRALNADGSAPSVQHDTTTYAAFGSLAYDFSEQLTTTLELRYSKDKVDVVGDDVDVFGRGGAFDGFLTESPQFLVDEKETFGALTARFSLDYQHTDDIMFYGTVSKGSKPGGVNIVGYGLTASSSPSDPNADKRFFDQEKIWNYEIGAKTEWFDNRLQFNAALYYIDYEDQQNTALCLLSICTSASPGAGGAPYIENASESSSKGIELDVTAVLNQHWSVFGSYAYTKAEFDDYVSDSGNVTTYVPSGDVSGNEFADVSPHVLNLGSRVVMPLSDAIDWFAQVDMQHKSSRYFDIIERIESGNKTDLDFQVGLEGGNWTVTAYAENLREEAMPSARPYFDLNAGFPLPRGQVVILEPKKTYGIRGVLRF